MANKKESILLIMKRIAVIISILMLAIAIIKKDYNKKRFT
jgi:hypothetical protein